MKTVVISKHDIVTAQNPTRMIIERLVKEGAPIKVIRESLTDTSDYKLGVDFKITGPITQYEDIYHDTDCMIYYFKD